MADAVNVLGNVSDAVMLHAVHFGDAASSHNALSDTMVLQVS